MNETAPPPRGSLIVVGIGISFIQQTTLEALACIERAEKLFYLVSDPAAGAWIEGLNSTAETLADCYAEGKPRSVAYREMVARILSAVRAGLEVCGAFYGHPGVFATPTHRAVRQARREGFDARMLPGISSEDCLFADLGVDPGKSGCQNFEATDFLASHRRFDASSALILWQVGALGDPSIRDGMAARPERLQVLTRVLRRHYPANHRLVLYEAAPFAVCDPKIERLPLSKLPQATVLPMTTLYIPPKPSRTRDPRITRWFDEP